MDPPVNRVAGSALFLNANPDTTPLALRADVEQNHRLHESVVIVSVDVTTVPSVPDSERASVDHLGYGDDGILRVTVRYGFQDDPDVPAALDLAPGQDLERSADLQGRSSRAGCSCLLDLARGPVW